MAKKNLTLLMDGFIGEAQTSSATQQQSIQGKSVAQEESQDAKPQNNEVNHVKGKHSKKCTFYTLRFGCSFAAVNTIKPQLL